MPCELDFPHAGSEHLVHCAVAVRGIDALDRVDELPVEMGDNPKADLHAKRLRSTTGEEVLRREPGQVDLGERCCPTEHLLRAPAEGSPVPADADVLGVIVDRHAQDRVPRFVMRRPGAHVEGLARASHAVPQSSRGAVGRFAWHCPANRGVAQRSRRSVGKARRKLSQVCCGLSACYSTCGSSCTPHQRAVAIAHALYTRSVNFACLTATVSVVNIALFTKGVNYAIHGTVRRFEAVG